VNGTTPDKVFSVFDLGSGQVAAVEAHDSLIADGILRLTFRLLRSGLPDIGFELHQQPLLTPPRNSEFSLHRVPAGGHLLPTRIGLPAHVAVHGLMIGTPAA